MNKQDLVKKLSDSAGLRRTEAESALDVLGAVIQLELAAGGEVTLPGVGKLAASKRPARTGRNPKTGEEITIAARVSPKFSAAKALKDALNPAPKAKGKK
jgi:DNA-binding protein HU-beta